MSITESGITLTFPDANYFRFADCASYIRLKGKGLKEMDACWYETATDTLYFIELKDFTTANLAATGHQIRSENLVKKAIDSLLMTASILLNKPEGKELRKDIPFEITSQTKLKLVTIINCNPSHQTYISAVRSAYQTGIDVYRKLLDVRTATVLTKDIAKTKFSWVS